MYRSANAPQILVVEDEVYLRGLLQRSLEKIGYNVLTAGNGIEALELMELYPVDLVLLDILMPQMDGLTTCQEIRKQSTVPIVILTALGTTDDLAQGLELGADDYIVKPFMFSELAAHLYSILRRTYWNGDNFTFLPGFMKDIELNMHTERLTVRGKPTPLNPTEYRLLKYLLLNADKVINMEILVTEIQRNQPAAKTNALHSYIRSLREKIEVDPSNPRYIITILGQGYRFNSEIEGHPGLNQVINS